jgi:regulatory protein
MKKRITDIQTEQAQGSQERIFLNGAFFASVDSSLVHNFGLRVGLEIEETTLQKLIAADEAVRAKNYALERLQGDTYTKTQMQECLDAEGFSRQAVRETLEYLEQFNYIRDKKYATWWVNRRRRSNPKGKQLLKQELLSKGVDENAANSVVDRIGDEDEAAMALQLAQKQAKRYRSLQPQAARRRLYAFLRRRGFDHDLIQKTLAQALEEEQARLDTSC